MSKLGWQSVALLLMATFGASSAVQAAADKAAAPAAPSPDQVQSNQSPAMFDDVLPVYGQGGGECQPRDLGLCDFFSAGWDDEWVKRQRLTGTPDMALLRVSTNFLEREVRVNYYTQTNVNSTTTRTVNETDALIAWSFNRRFMIEITGAYQWNDPRTGAETNGGTPGIVGRFQLVDSESSSLAVNLKATEPDPILGVTQTTFAYGLSGFEDLAYWFNLDRVGFYYSFQFDTYAGPAAVGAKNNDIGYDITVAKTLLPPDTPLLGNFSVYLENYASTDLDGSHNGRTLVSLTPGVRFNLGKCEDIKMGKDNCLLFGADIPVSDYHPWDTTYRVSYIKNF